MERPEKKNYPFDAWEFDYISKDGNSYDGDLQTYIDYLEAQLQGQKLPIAIVGGSYLVKFVDPEKEYAVEYTIKQDGTRVDKPQMLIGADLTQPQIVALFNKQLL